MAIVNRDLGHSEQRKNYRTSISALATGVTTIVGTIPCNMNLDAAQAVAFGLSGSPVYLLSVNRFIVGTGFTTIAIGTSFAPVEFGTSGVQGATFGISLPIIGSTVTSLLTNDMLILTSGGANSAVKALEVSLVLRPIVDINRYFNIM